MFVRSRRESDRYKLFNSRSLAQQFRTKIELAQVLLTQALEQGLPFTTVLMDRWYLSSALVQALAIAKKDWVSLLKRNRNLETGSFQLKDATGQPIVLPQAQIKVEDLVPLIPSTAYRKIVQDSQEYWCFSFCARIAGFGRVRLVISFENPQLTGTFAVLISNRTDWSAPQMLVVPLSIRDEDTEGRYPFLGVTGLLETRVVPLSVT